MFIELGSRSWIEGQRVMWLTKMKAAIGRATKDYGRYHQSKINTRQQLNVLIPIIVEGGDRIIKWHDEMRTPIRAAA